MNNSFTSLENQSTRNLTDVFLRASSHQIGMRYLYLFGILFLFALLPIFLLLSSSRLLGLEESFSSSFALTSASHGIIFVFFIFIPFFHTIGTNLWLPKLLNYKNDSLTKLNNLSFLLYNAAFIVFITGSIYSPQLTDWKLYKIEYYDSFGIELVLLAIGLVVLSTIISSIRTIVIIYGIKRLKFSDSKSKILLNSFYLSSFIYIIALPVLLMYILMILSEIKFGLGILDSKMGGDVVFSMHLFWIGVHPLFYALFIFAAGILSHFTISKIELYNKRISACFGIIAIFGLLSWGQHLYFTGLSEKYSLIFSFFGMLPIIPISYLIVILLMNWFKRSYSDSNQRLFVIFSLLSVVLGSITGMMLITPLINSQLHNSIFISGHFHLLLFGFIGSTIMILVLHLWESIWKIKYHKIIMKISIFCLFGGLLLSEGTKLFSGLRGVSNFSFYSQLNFGVELINSIGLFFVLQGVVMIVFNLLYHLYRSRNRDEEIRV
ncbi:MAG: hypothetical protein DWP97_05985 [Calditrichaeota bacterium]|nr:MAG: hypothetical protein DWP97_05985 [Calditrichota bacterium]